MYQESARTCQEDARKVPGETSKTRKPGHIYYTHMIHNKHIFLFIIYHYCTSHTDPLISLVFLVSPDTLLVASWHLPDTRNLINSE